MNFKTRNGVIDLKLYGFATEIIYENKFGKGIDQSENNAIGIVNLFWCVVLANLDRMKWDKLSFEEFLDDIYDLNDGDVTITKFYAWFIKQKKIENEMLPKIIEEELDNKKK